MAGSDTLDVDFDDVPAEPVGPPGGYTGPARLHATAAWAWPPAGTAGPAPSADTLLAAAASRDVGPHALAHLGAVDIALTSARAALDRAADEIDADPCDLDGTGPAARAAGAGPGRGGRHRGA